MRLLHWYYLALFALLAGLAAPLLSKELPPRNPGHAAVAPTDTLVLLGARDLERAWSESSADETVRALMHAALLRGFELPKYSGRRWGAEYGAREQVPERSVTPGKRRQSLDEATVRWMLFGLDPNAAGERCTLVIWRRGAEQRSTLLVARNAARPEDAQEWTVDKKGELVKAPPLGRCLLEGIAMLCAPLCPGALQPCLRASGSRDDADGRDTGAPAPATLLQCLSETCPGCVTLAVARCGRVVGGTR